MRAQSGLRPADNRLIGGLPAGRFLTAAAFASGIGRHRGLANAMTIRKSYVGQRPAAGATSRRQLWTVIISGKSPGPGPRGRMVGRFAGRERELAAIVRGARGSAAAVVLAGPTGVGKSRLAARGPAELGRYGWSTDTVRGTSSARDTPHRALAHLLPAVMPAGVINPLRWAVDQMVPAGQRRRALLVDDAHQLDAASSGRGEPSGRATPGNGARLRQNRRTHPRCDRLAVAGGPRRTDRAGSAVRRGNRTYRAGRVEGCDRARDARTPCSGADLLFRGRRIAWPLP